MRGLNEKPHAGQSMGFQRDLGNSDTQILATPNRQCKRYHADDFNDLAQFAQRLGVIGGALQ